MGRMITGAFPESVKVGLRNVSMTSLANAPKEGRQWINVITGPDPGGEAGRNFLEDLQVAGFGTFAPKPQGDPIVYDDMIEGNLVRATPYAFALGARITRELKADGRYGIFEDIARRLARAAWHQMEFQMHRPINLGTGTTGGTGFTASGFDTLALFSSAHTLLGGGTAANRLTTDLALTVTSYELAIDTFEGTVDERNQPDPRQAALLYVPYQLKWKAIEILESELKPYSANNEVNPVKGETQWMISHFLTDTDGWTIFGSKGGDSEGGHDINCWFRELPDFDMSEDYDTKDSKYSGYFRLATWHGSWRSSFHSSGS